MALTIDLSGRVAAVTGAGAGMGLAIATELARAGADVAVLELDPATAQAAAERLEGLGVRARPYPLDVCDASAVEAALSALERDLGPLDMLVNNAGISRVGPHTEDVTDADWDDSIAVMQSGVFACMRAAGRRMLPRGSGSVVNVSSIRGHSPRPGRIAYSAAKAAVEMMTKTAAGEWAPHGVRVNCVAPGVMRTPMWDRDVARGVLDEPAIEAAVPARRIGDPSEVGKLVVYLCSDAAAYVTGSVVTIDGGLTSVSVA